MNIDHPNLLMVQNWGSSGSTLLQSLLDGHPHILSFPALNIKEFYYWWESSEGDFESRVRQFHQVFRKLFHEDAIDRHLGLHQMGPNMDQCALVDETIFKSQFLAFWTKNQKIENFRKRFFISAYYAYGASLGRNLEDIRFLLFPVHAAPHRHMKMILEDFSNPLFLYTVRNPISTSNSMIKHVEFNRYVGRWWKFNAAECLLAGLMNDFTIQSGRYFCFGETPYLPQLANNCRAIKLEEMHERPREIMAAICDWLGLPWSDELLKSTYNGLVWWNRLESPRSAGTDKSLATARGNYLNESDRSRLTILMMNKFKIWNYKFDPPNLWTQFSVLVNFWKPFSFENGKICWPRAYFWAAKTFRKVGLHSQASFCDWLVDITEAQERVNKTDFDEISQTHLYLDRTKLRFTQEGEISVQASLRANYEAKSWLFHSRLILAQLLATPAALGALGSDYLKNRYWYLRAFFVQGRKSDTVPPLEMASNPGILSPHSKIDRIPEGHRI